MLVEIDVVENYAEKYERAQVDDCADDCVGVNPPAGVSPP
jgi:hypothetical protein